MSASFKRIDYSLRPAKHAERRMLCDLFRRLRPFGRLEDYVYVGFGSVWFSDFSLFHRALGIREMISIEEADTARERIEANKPFRIPVDYRPSNDALPDLDWLKNLFIWLDYDDPISTDMLLDMKTVARRAKSGTALAVSVQCSCAPQVAEAEQDHAAGALGSLERFVALFGRERVPDGTLNIDLYGWRFGNLSRRILLQEIQAELATRNAADGTSVFFHPVCEIEYEDGAKMTTVVGVFCSPEDEALLQQCHFDGLDFLHDGPKPVRISVPKITAREFKLLESQLPLPEGGELAIGTIPLAEARHFSKMYRYLPSYAVLEG